MLKEKWHAPAPRHEVFLGEPLHQQKTSCGHQPADGAAHLREAAEEAAPLAAGVLRGHEHRAAPLAADRHALHEAQQDHQNRRPRSYGRIAGHQPHRKSGQAHHRQREHERGLPPAPVADVAEDQAADRPRHEPDRERGERGEGARQLGEGGEEQPAEYQRRRRPENEEVVPLDGSTDHAGERDSPNGLRGAEEPCVV
jgi:hypothetical protein